MDDYKEKKPLIRKLKKKLQKRIRRQKHLKPWRKKKLLQKCQLANLLASEVCSLKVLIAEA